MSRHSAESGIASSAAHAGKEWAETAMHFVNWYWRSFGQRAPRLDATAEEMRSWASMKGLPDPPDQRAWGSVTREAIRQGVIVPTGGYAPAISSHNAPKRLYRSGRHA